MQLQECHQRILVPIYRTLPTLVHITKQQNEQHPSKKICLSKLAGFLQSFLYCRRCSLLKCGCFCFHSIIDTHDNSQCCVPNLVFPEQHSVAGQPWFFSLKTMVFCLVQFFSPFRTRVTSHLCSQCSRHAEILGYPVSEKETDIITQFLTWHNANRSCHSRG